MATKTSDITYEHLLALESHPVRGFWEDVDITDDPTDCWEWTRGHSGYYGRVHVTPSITGLERTVVMHAHRISLMLATGDLLPAGMFVDHVCGNTLCVNPHHLELVTPRVNSQRARRTIAAIQADRWGLPAERLIHHPNMRTEWLNRPVRRGLPNIKRHESRYAVR